MSISLSYHQPIIIGYKFENCVCFLSVFYQQNNSRFVVVMDVLYNIFFLLEFVVKMADMLSFADQAQITEGLDKHYQEDAAESKARMSELVGVLVPSVHPPVVARILQRRFRA